MYDEQTGKITAPVSIDDISRCFRVVLERTVNNTIETSLSNDLGTIVGAKVGTNIPDIAGGTQWTVKSREDINPWARYKPTAAAPLDALNTPMPLSDYERETLGWGLETDWDTAQYLFTSYVCDLLNNAGGDLSREMDALKDLGIKVRTFQERSWKRLTDFVCNNDRNKGYYHFAKPHKPSWHFSDGSQTYTIGEPLIPENKRNYLEIEVGVSCKVTAPNDSMFLAGWLNKETIERSGHTVVRDNISVDEELSLSLVDALVNLNRWYSNDGNTHQDNSLTWRNPRGLWVFVDCGSDGEVKWRPFGSYRGVYKSGDSPTITPESSLDLQSSTQDTNVIQTLDGRYVKYDSDGNFVRFLERYDGNIDPVPATWKDLQGRCLFTEFYFGDNSVLPIPEYAYFVNIVRVKSGEGSGTVDIDGVLFIRFPEGQSSREGVFVGVYRNGGFGSQSAAVAVLREYYDEMTVALCRDQQGMDAVYSVNMLTETADRYDGSVTERIDGTNYNGCWLGYVVPYDSVDTTTPTMYWVVSVTKKNGATASAYIQV